MKNVLVIGLGSMGKRRIRCLQALGIQKITGVDVREDRCLEAKECYGIQTDTSLDKILSENNFDCWVISLPPNIHHIYIKKSLLYNTPCFVEASVLDTDFDEIISQSKQRKILVAPSCTLLFHPAIKKIKQIVDSKELGTLTNIIYHSGQYLPDWHTYENVSEYYVSNPETGGAREIVPFELTWLTKLFGFPQTISGMFKKTIHIEGAEKIDDTYNILMDYPSFILNLSVDVVSRYASRRLTINGSKKQLYWSWDENTIKIYDPGTGIWNNTSYQTTSAESGYNKNITEQIYIDEIGNFLNAVDAKEKFLNTMEEDQAVLDLLYKAEKSYTSHQHIQ